MLLVTKPLLICHYAKSLLVAHNTFKTRFLQAFKCPTRDRAARLTFQIANIVEQPSASLEHPKQLPIKLARIELARQAKHRRIVKNPRETFVLEAAYNLKGIAHHL